MTDCGPHDAGEREPPLGAPHAEPAHAERGAEPDGGNAGMGLDGLLRAAEVLLNEARRAEAEKGMGVAVIADRMAGRGDFAGHGRQPLDIGATLEKRSRHLVAGEDFEELGRALAGPIVEGERDGAPRRIAVPEGSPEDRRRAPADSPGQERPGRQSAGSADGQGVHESLL